MGKIVLKSCRKSLTCAGPLTLPSALLPRVGVLKVCSTGPLFPSSSCFSQEFAPCFPYEFVWLCVWGASLTCPHGLRPLFLLCTVNIHPCHNSNHQAGELASPKSKLFLSDKCQSGSRGVGVNPHPRLADPSPGGAATTQGRKNISPLEL